MSEKLDYKKATAILFQNDFSKCNSCAYRTEEVFDPNGIMQCSITCLSMCNGEGECIWYEKGLPFSKKININLAKKRMGKGNRIYFFRSEYVDG